MGEFHGDELELENEYRECQESYEHEHSDDWKYSDERINEDNRAYGKCLILSQCD